MLNMNSTELIHTNEYMYVYIKHTVSRVFILDIIQLLFGISKKCTYFLMLGLKILHYLENRHLVVT